MTILYMKHNRRTAKNIFKVHLAIYQRKVITSNFTGRKTVERGELLLYNTCKSYTASD